MKQSVAPPLKHIRRIEDGVSFHAETAWVMAALLLGAGLVCLWYFELPLNFDFNSSNFSPVIFVPVFLGLFGLKYLFSAVLGTWQSRKFKKSVLEMEGHTVAPGEILKGVIRTSVEIKPPSDYELILTCVEAITAYDSLKNTHVTRDHIRWSATNKVTAPSVSSTHGIPVEFHIPKEALAMGDSRATGQIRWTLEIKAELPGVDYYAIFGVEVREG